HAAISAGVSVLVAGRRCRITVAFWLSTFIAVERAEYRSRASGVEAHMSERSELCAVPSTCEERREPAGKARRIASGRCFLWATFLCTSKERWLAPAQRE